MLFKRYGRTELNISVLTFGAMRIPFNEGAAKVKERAEKESNAVETVRRAAELGINHIDTARAYGNSERLVGLGLKEVGRERFFLTTKIGAGTPRDETRRAIDDSCEKMGVEYIDIVDVHGINTPEKFTASLSPEGTHAGILKAMEDGRVRHAAFSTHGPSEIIRQTIDTDLFSAVSLHYFISHRRNADVVAHAHARDMGVLILSATEKPGLLTRPTQKLADVCAPFTPCVLAHRWLLAKQAVTTLAVGPANPGEFDAHMGACARANGLNAEEQAAVARWEKAERTALGSTLCTLCYKCMPCPEEVAIPEILRLRNLGRAFGMLEFGKMRYNLLENGQDWFPGKKASYCTRCNECMPRCPEHLSIPELLEETHEMLQGKTRKRLWE